VILESPPSRELLPNILHVANNLVVRNLSSRQSLMAGGGWGRDVNYGLRPSMQTPAPFRMREESSTSAMFWIELSA
jgi:hypothetical protein